MSQPSILTSSRYHPYTSRSGYHPTGLASSVSGSICSTSKPTENTYLPPSRSSYLSDDFSITPPKTRLEEEWQFALAKWRSLQYHPTHEKSDVSEVLNRDRSSMLYPSENALSEQEAELLEIAKLDSKLQYQNELMNGQFDTNHYPFPTQQSSQSSYRNRGPCSSVAASSSEYPIDLSIDTDAVNEDLPMMSGGLGCDDDGNYDSPIPLFSAYGDSCVNSRPGIPKSCIRSLAPRFVFRSSQLGNVYKLIRPLHSTRHGRTVHFTDPSSQSTNRITKSYKTRKTPSSRPKNSFPSRARDAASIRTRNAASTGTSDWRRQKFAASALECLGLDDQSITEVSNAVTMYDRDTALGDIADSMGPDEVAIQIAMFDEYEARKAFGSITDQTDITGSEVDK